MNAFKPVVLKVAPTSQLSQKIAYYVKMYRYVHHVKAPFALLRVHSMADTQIAGGLAHVGVVEIVLHIFWKTVAFKLGISWLIEVRL